MTDLTTYELRRADVDDARVIQHHRDAMFLEMGIDPEVVGAASEPARAWTTRALASGTYTGLLYAAAGAPSEVVAGCGVTRLDLPPNMHTAVARRGYVLNMYVEPGHRRRGLARSLVTQAIEVCRSAGVDLVSLHASGAGRPLYADLGFVPTNELRLSL